MLKISNRILTGITLVIIILHGILRIWIIKAYASIVKFFLRLVNQQSNPIIEFFKNQSRTPEYNDQALGWFLYYPTYFLLHLLFIQLLFKKQKRIRLLLTLGLTSLLTLIIFFWIFFLLIEQPSIAYFFRIQFRNLFGLPFILLAIEGGKILYNDLQNRLS